MNPANESSPGSVDLEGVARSVLIYQAVITVMVAVAFLLVSGLQSGVAALYGGTSAWILTWLRKRGISGAVGLDTKKNMSQLYMGAIQRFFSVLLLFTMGLAVLKLEPLVCIVGFGLCQSGYLFIRVLQKGQ